MSSNFPAGFDSIAADKSNSTVALNDHSSHHNDLADAVNAIQTSLGVNLANVIGLPQQSQSANYTLTLADAGKSVVHPITDNNARTFTIPPNFSVAYPVGTQITFVNMANTLTVELANDLMYLAGFSTYPPASVRLDAYGVATALKVSNTSWIISGQNLTADASLSYNFLDASSLPSSITFTRASTATFFNSAGVLTSAAINTPRFDYNPATLAAQGLLIEEQRTNLLVQSQTFQTTWILASATLSTDATTAPDGTLTADKLIVDNGVSTTGANSNGGIAQNPAGTTAIPYSYSIFAKAAEVNSIRIRETVTTGAIAKVSLIDGSVVYEAGSASSFTVVSTFIGNGWWRITAIRTPATTLGFVFKPGIDTGNGTSGIFIWGAQLEAGAFPTSYIPTTTTALTRSADVASVNTLSPWFNATEGTLYGEVSSAAQTVSGVSRRIANINDGTEADRIAVGWAGATSVAAAFVTDNSVTQASFTSPSGAYPFPTKVALAYKAADFQAAVNGSAFAAVSSGTVPTVNRMTIGDVVTGSNGTQNINGHIRRITYYPRRLSQAELTAITA